MSTDARTFQYPTGGNTNSAVTTNGQASAAHSFLSDAICKRRPSDMPESGFATTSLLAGSPTFRITPLGRLAFCLFSRLALGLDLLRSFAFCLCGSIHLRDPGSFSLCLLGRFALDFAGGFTLRLLRRLALLRGVFRRTTLPMRRRSAEATSTNWRRVRTLPA